MSGLNTSPQFPFTWQLKLLIGVLIVELALLVALAVSGVCSYSVLSKGIEASSAGLSAELRLQAEAMLSKAWLPVLSAALLTILPAYLLFGILKRLDWGRDALFAHVLTIPIYLLIGPLLIMQRFADGSAGVANLLIELREAAVYMVPATVFLLCCTYYADGSRPVKRFSAAFVALFLVLNISIVVLSYLSLDPFISACLGYFAALKR